VLITEQKTQNYTRTANAELRAQCVGDHWGASQGVTYYSSSKQIRYGKEIAFEVSIERNDADLQITKNITKT
jgi:hypothetical protein